MTLRELEGRSFAPYTVKKAKRGDGTTPVVFQVPIKQRPPGWPATIPLPIQGRTGKLDDAELDAIERDSHVVYRRMQQELAIAQGLAVRPMATLKWFDLGEMWLQSDQVTRRKPPTKRNYRYAVNHAVKRLDADPRWNWSTMTESVAEQFLRPYENTPHQRYIVFFVLKNMLGKAYREGLRGPFLHEIRAHVPNEISEKTLWEKSVVHRACRELDGTGDRNLAGIIRVAFALAQRGADVREFRFGVHYGPDGWFRFRQSKTKKRVTTPAPPKLRAYLDSLPFVHGEVMFPNENTGRAFLADTLAQRWLDARRAFSPDILQGADDLVLQELRHSGVVQLARAGCTIAEIGSITGHSYQSIERMLEHYLPADSICAVNAMRKLAYWHENGDPDVLFVEGERRMLLTGPKADDYDLEPMT